MFATKLKCHSKLKILFDLLIWSDEEHKNNLLQSLFVADMQTPRIVLNFEGFDV